MKAKCIQKFFLGQNPTNSHRVMLQCKGRKKPISQYVTCYTGSSFYKQHKSKENSWSQELIRRYPSSNFQILIKSHFKSKCFRYYLCSANETLSLWGFRYLIKAIQANKVPDRNTGFFSQSRRRFISCCCSCNEICNRIRRIAFSSQNSESITTLCQLSLVSWSNRKECQFMTITCVGLSLLSTSTIIIIINAIITSVLITEKSY